MIWNKHKKEEESYVASEDFAVRLFEIQTRIAALKSRFGWTEKSNKNTAVQSQSMVVPEKQISKPSNKEAEIEDLKAKLLGKKR